MSSSHITLLRRVKNAIRMSRVPVKQARERRRFRLRDGENVARGCDSPRATQRRSRSRNPGAHAVAAGVFQLCRHPACSHADERHIPEGVASQQPRSHRQRGEGRVLFFKSRRKGPRSALGLTTGASGCHSHNGQGEKGRSGPRR